jgi:hypothetical protein
LPLSELENSEGYTDIYLEARRYLYPKIKYEWVLELKYIKQSESDNDTLFEAKKKEALEQLQRYKTSNRFKDKSDMRYLAVIFVGKKEFFIFESL